MGMKEKIPVEVAIVLEALDVDRQLREGGVAAQLLLNLRGCTDEVSGLK